MGWTERKSAAQRPLEGQALAQREDHFYDRKSSRRSKNKAVKRLKNEQIRWQKVGSPWQIK
jgi:hypothetical protein